MIGHYLSPLVMSLLLIACTVASAYLLLGVHIHSTVLLALAIAQVACLYWLKATYNKKSNTQTNSEDLILRNKISDLEQTLSTHTHASWQHMIDLSTNIRILAEQSSLQLHKSFHALADYASEGCASANNQTQSSPSSVFQTDLSSELTANSSAIAEHKTLGGNSELLANRSIRNLSAGFKSNELLQQMNELAKLVDSIVELGSHSNSVALNHPTKAARADYIAHGQSAANTGTKDLTNTSPDILATLNTKAHAIKSKCVEINGLINELALHEINDEHPIQANKNTSARHQAIALEINKSVEALQSADRISQYAENLSEQTTKIQAGLQQSFSLKEKELPSLAAINAIHTNLKNTHFLVRTRITKQDDLNGGEIEFF